MILYQSIYLNWDTLTYTDPQTAGTSAVSASAFLVSDNVAPPPFFVATDAPEEWVVRRAFVEGIAPTIPDYVSFRFQVCLRIEAIAGTDYSNWTSLSSEQQVVALHWCNIRVANALGILAFQTLCGSRAACVSIIREQLERSYTARLQRYTLFKIALFSMVEKIQGLRVVNHFTTLGLLDLYLREGIAKNSTDGHPGIVDYVLSNDVYAKSGLLYQVQVGAIVVSSINVLANSLVACTKLANQLALGYVL